MFEPEECMTAQDSTTREQTLCFSHGDDFLFQLKDDKYYHGTVVEDMFGISLVLTEMGEFV